MRKLYKNIITEQEADDLSDIIEEFGRLDGQTRLCDSRTASPGITFSNDIVFRMCSEIKQDLPKIKLSEPSYVRLERKGKGHPPHFDGCLAQDGKLVGNHMAWCRHTASILLTSPASFRGGSFKFLTDPKETYKKDHYLNLLVYSSATDNDPQEHLVDPHTEGDRVVLLMFFAEEGRV